MRASKVHDALREHRHRPVSLRRVAILAGVQEGTVRHAIKSGALPEPLCIEGEGGKPGRPFFLASMVDAWINRRRAR